jgi:hypothetical protein
VASNSEGPSDPYRESQERLRSHPGYVEQQSIRAFTATLEGVYEQNWHELNEFLICVESDMEYASALLFELGESFVRPTGVNATFDRLLHNYVAASMTLVGHSRKLMGKRSGRLAERFKERKKALLEHPEMAFIQGLRNFSLHRALPLVGYNLSWTRGQQAKSEMQLSVSDLLTFDDWKRPARGLIAQYDEVLPIRPVVERHHSMFYEFNSWLAAELHSANAQGRAEANVLVVQSNAALMGTDYQTALRRTIEDETRRG